MKQKDIKKVHKTKCLKSGDQILFNKPEKLGVKGVYI